ncbi:hypothetical protein [Kitasatospora sp. NPDC015120]|uniref:hypothetical protein n=1 Tax=Kitasatospora sp. NPDC015120 TaxID=3364023 RepID=UPI0036F46343
MTTTGLSATLPGITARGYRLAGLGTPPLALPCARRLVSFVNADTGISVLTFTDRTTILQVKRTIGYELISNLPEFRLLETVTSLVRLAEWAAQLHPRLIDIIADALASGAPLADALSDLDDQMRRMLIAAIATDLPEVGHTSWRSEFDRLLYRLLLTLALAAHLCWSVVAAAAEEPPPGPRCGPDLPPLTMACGIRRRTIPIVPRTLHLGPRAHGVTGFRLAA